MKLDQEDISLFDALQACPTLRSDVRSSTDWKSPDEDDSYGEDSRP